LWKAEANWDNKCGKQRQSGIINVETEAKWDNKCGKKD